MAGGISDLEEGKIILAHGKIDLNRGQGQNMGEMGVRAKKRAKS